MCFFFSRSKECLLRASLHCLSEYARYSPDRTAKSPVVSEVISRSLASQPPTGGWMPTRRHLLTYRWLKETDLCQPDELRAAQLLARTR